MNDDFPADATTTGVFTIFGSAVSARHESPGDVDWIRVEGLQRYFEYDVWLWRSTDDDFISSADFFVYNAASRLVYEPRFTESVPGRKRYQHFGSNEEHYIAIKGLGDNTGGYRLFVRPSDYPGDTFAEAAYFSTTTFNRFASALETNADTDFLRYRLFAGTEYTFNLRGKESESSINTTLERMTFRLLDLGGNIISEDDTNGVARGASISFTPGTTSDYVFQVDSDNATGSYIIESQQLDDFRGDTDTRGVLQSDGTPVMAKSNFRRTAFGFHDSDWFRLETLDGFTYEVESDEASLDLRDADGELMSANFLDERPRRKFRFTANGNATVFVSATALGAENLYSVSANIVDDHVATFTDATRFEGNTAFARVDGAIEIAGDRDWIRMSFARLASHSFTIEADPALRMALSIRNEAGEIIANGKPLTPLKFAVPDGSNDRFFYVDVRSNANKTGTWTLRSRVALGGNDDSTMWNVDMSNGSGRIRSLIQIFDGAPEQWHRFQVTPNTWYEMKRTGADFDVRLGNSDSPGVRYRGSRPTSYYFSGSSTLTDRYIVIDPEGQNVGGQRGFEIKIVKDARPRLTSTAQYSPSNQRFGNDTFGFQNAEVYSSVPFTYQDGDQTVSVAAQTYATVTPTQWFSIILDDNFDESGELFFRDVRPKGNSQWSAMELYGHNLPADVPRNFFNFPGREPLTFAFADSKPAYLADDSIVGDTQTLTEAERQEFSRAFFEWDRLISYGSIAMVDPGADNDAAAIMIYKAELDSDVLAFSLNGDTTGAGIAGDIILNVNSPLWDDLSGGTRGPFEILRGIGKSLGAADLPTVGRDLSVMGAELTGDRADLPYSTTLLPYDIQALRSPTDTFPHSVTKAKEYFLDENVPRYDSIIHNGSFDESFISAQTSSLNATIDLRPGEASFLTDGDSQPSTWVMSKFSFVADARGGSGSDHIRGNQFNNVLFGNAGSDVLIGGVGDDFLSGGTGDDMYTYRLGHDSDVINEFDGGGTEILNVQGWKDFDGLEDLQFRRFGNNLRISLELDGRDKNADSIIIQNMGSPDSAIERLDLFRETTSLDPVSLMSVWEQADEQLRRFQFAQGSDNFGRLVSPV